MSETTELGFSYEHSVDINVGTPSVPVWQNIRFITAVDPQVTPVTQDAATYDDDGAPNLSKTSESWTLAFGVQMHRLTSGAYLPEVEALLSYTLPTATGNAAIAHLRWYDDPAGLDVVPNPNDAFEGVGTVAMVRNNTANDGIGGWNVTITGQGRRTKIDNPAGADEG